MMMLYRPPRGAVSDAGEETVIPAGRPYITKVNGELVMARAKSSKTVRAISLRPNREHARAMDITRPMDATMNLLGEAFGIKPRVASYKRVQSQERPTQDPPVAMAAPYGPQQHFAHSTPLLQGAVPTMANFPPILPPQQQVQYVVAQPGTTNPDLDQLRKIDAHYRSISAGCTSRKSSSTMGECHKGEETSSKTTITITRHICANCRRLRSKSYHATHPIKAGETPLPEFCRKCQRDASSTSSSSGSSSSSCSRGGTSHKYRKKHQTKAKARKDRKKQRTKGSSNQDDTSLSSGSRMEQKPQPKTQQPVAEPTRQEDDIGEPQAGSEKQTKTTRSILSKGIISTDIGSSDEEDVPRGRTRLRLEQSEVSRRPFSPLVSHHHLKGSSRSGYGQYEPPKVLQSRHRRRLQPRQEPHDPLFYEYVPAREVRLDPYERYGRQSPAQHVEEENIYPESSRGSRRHNGPYPPPIMANGEDSLESSSSRSRESARRRRLERAYPKRETTPSWGRPHAIRTRPRDESVMSTDQYLHRTRKLPNAERKRRPYEDSDTHSQAQSRIHSFPAEDHAYYQDDWASEDPFRTAEESVGRAGSNQGQPSRRGRYDDLDPSDSEEANDYAVAYTPAPNHLPPAPTPPSRRKSAWTSSSESSDDEEAQAASKEWKDKPIHEDTGMQSRGSSRSQHRSEGKATGSTAKPQPEPTAEPDPFYADINTLINGGIDERENLAEAETRHVSFRDRDSVDAAQSWDESVRSKSAASRTGGWYTVNSSGGNGWV